MNIKNSIYISLLSASFILPLKAQEDKIKKYLPQDKVLYSEIEAMDKLFFEAYNSCDLKKQEAIYSDNIEFFHDKGGLMTSKAEILKGTKENVCGKVTRQIVPGSIEIYAIKDYGAVEIGYHKFYNNQEPNAESVPAKFIIIWKKENGNWRITKVVSLH